jgi:uncharacterized membrane protein (UPF0182 family)
MTEQARLFYAARQQYPELTVKDVEDYYKLQTVTEKEYTYTKEKDVYVITKEGETVSRIKGTDADVEKQIQQMQDSGRFQKLLDGLLQFVYDKLKGVVTK